MTRSEVRRLSLSQQITVLRRSVEKGLRLRDELRKLGSSYEALRYRHNGRVLGNKSTYLQVDALQAKATGVPSVSFFSGCGGMDLGFESAGFEHLGCFEVVECFCETLRTNRPTWRVFGPPEKAGDLRERDETAAILRGELGLPQKFEGVFYGGPPCQSFSVAANQRFSRSGQRFKRVGFEHKEYGTLLFDYVEYVLRFRPRAFLLENVPGLQSVDRGKQLKRVCESFSSGGYRLSGPFVLDAAKFGVPQHRNRLFLVGWRGAGHFTFPQEESAAIPCVKALDGPLCGLSNTATRAHKASSVMRYMELGYGERDALGRVDRLDPNRPSKTVIAGGDKGGGRSHLHPFIPRTLSVREGARLQTFPDDFVFAGTSGRQFTQVGNAVPPMLAFKLARAIYEGIFS